MSTRTHRGRARPYAIALLVVSSASVFAAGAAAQDNAANDVPDSTSVLIARADSARAELVQPPGAYDGIRTMDVLRIPFQLFGAGVALGAAAVGGTYYVANKLLINPAIKARGVLAGVDVDVGVGSLGTRSWPGLILRYEGLSPLFAEVGYSVRQYQLYRAGIAHGEEGDAGFSFEATGAYRRLRQPNFWGIGPDTEVEDRSDFSQDMIEAGATGRWRAEESGITLYADGGWERSEVGWGWEDKLPDVTEVFGTGSLFGLDEPVEYVRVGGSAGIDRTRLRDRHLRGYGALAEWHHYEGVSGTPSSFENVAGEARFFVPVNERTLVALRLLAEDNLGVKGQGVPFTHLARLGDDRGLRGYSGRRFRDLAMAAGQLEWRYEAYWTPGFPDLRLDAFTFVDAGTVGPSLSEIRHSTIHTTPGIGLRALDKGISRAEVFLVFGGDYTRVGFQIGSTF